MTEHQELRARLTGALIGLARATDGNEHLINPSATAAVLDTASRWYGVTYREDREAVMTAFNAMHADGTYPKLK